MKGEKVLPPDPELLSPICPDGRNVCPPEDVGGVPGNIDLLDAIIDPAYQEHREGPLQE
ncbi:hypothetical protein OKW30_007924 [Paraburkholderia sp. Clong3]|uniref:plasmid pRiA4b ORF-3 family protein n=1 Tax=Paraburkholderia TaxID=1822464 RepID=UPI000A65E956|nr:plasmid pRiA4b ORF-3 family protein [Paraburkholderia tuberum]